MRLRCLGRACTCTHYGHGWRRCWCARGGSIWPRRASHSCQPAAGWTCWDTKTPTSFTTDPATPAVGRCAAGRTATCIETTRFNHYVYNPDRGHLRREPIRTSSPSWQRRRHGWAEPDSEANMTAPPVSAFCGYRFHQADMTNKQRPEGRQNCVLSRFVNLKRLTRLNARPIDSVSTHRNEFHRESRRRHLCRTGSYGPRRRARCADDRGSRLARACRRSGARILPGSRLPCRCQRPHRGLRDGKVGPCSAEDRRDIRLNRDTRAVCASGRGVAWRPRHDPARGRHTGAVQFRGNG
jgi:hypothetical protein